MGDNYHILKKDCGVFPVELPEIPENSEVAFEVCKIAFPRDIPELPDGEWWFCGEWPCEEKFIAYAGDGPLASQNTTLYRVEAEKKEKKRR